MENQDYFISFYRDEAKAQNFSVNRIGVCEHMKPGMVNRPGGTGDSLLMFFHDKAIVNIKDEILPVPAGSLIYWEKCGHYYGNADNNWMHSWIHFDGWEATEIMRRAGMLPYQIITPPARIVKKMLKEIDCEMSMMLPDMIIVRNRFEIFIREIFRTGTKEKSSIRIPERMIEVRRYIEANYRKRLPLEKISRRFSISRPHLSAEFKRWFGQGPGECLIERRLREAEILLKDNNLQIADVAERVGWDDVCHFSKIFKKHRGVPPSAMREKVI